MITTNRAVFGVFKSRSDVDAAVDTLRDDGFTMNTVSVLLPQSLGEREFFHTRRTKLAEGAFMGALIGGSIGLIVGLGSLAFPEYGGLFACVVGVGFGGLLGLAGGSLIGYGIPEYEAKRYEGFVKKGGILLSVPVNDSDWGRKAKNSMESTGATAIAVSSELSHEWRVPKNNFDSDSMHLF